VTSTTAQGTTGFDGIRRGDHALVLKPVLKAAVEIRDPEAGLAEAIGLAQAINLEVVEAAVLKLASPTPATLLGKGQAEKYGNIIAEKNITVAIVDHMLTPVQQRNLETAWKCKVIDRTGLILEIFGERAQTKEGQLQVDLAALEYQKSRLVRSWTHLERQRGGFGFLGGPGESQLETDRRLINHQIMRLKGELKQVIRTRGLQREARVRAEHPTVALVGYTNAGKSSLFNRLTGADVLAKNMLFATLDPAMRGIKLPSGRQAVLSDTVGFISELPTHLVEAFRATLEEVRLADVILHVRDVAHPESKVQKRAVLDVLRDLGIGADDERLIEVLNKVDLLPQGERKNVKDYAARTTWDETRAPTAIEGVRHEAHGGVVGVSALTGDGVPELLELLDAKLARHAQVYDIDIARSDGAALSWLYAHGKVVGKRDTAKKSHIKVEMGEADYGRFQSRFGKE
jgi:GTP-binding protein HflX